MYIVETKLNLKIKEKVDEQGFNSEVFIAYDPQLNTNLILKRISKQKLDRDKINN